MPYRWINDEKQTRLELWPHKSLPRKGFAWMIIITFILIIMPLFAVLGTVLLWGLLPFLIGAVVALWWGLEKSDRDKDIYEVLTLTPTQSSLSHQSQKSNPKTWACNAYWTQAHLHKTGGRVPNYITLSGNQREVEIGAFLSEKERLALYDELTRALDKFRG